MKIGQPIFRAQLSIVFALATTFYACGSNHKHNSNDIDAGNMPHDDRSGPHSGDGKDKNESTTPSLKPHDINLKALIVIREFGETDNAALFIALPSDNQTLTFEEVSGPQFLGNAYVGILDDKFLSKVFTKSAVPMSDAERHQLISVYKSAGVIYFESYRGSLCTDEEQDISAKGAIRGDKLSVDFKFAAKSQQGKSCELRESGITWVY